MNENTLELVLMPPWLFLDVTVPVAAIYKRNSYPIDGLVLFFMSRLELNIERDKTHFNSYRLKSFGTSNNTYTHNANILKEYFQ